MGNVIERGAYKKGGKVKETGKAMLHKGELVLTAKQAKAKKKHDMMEDGTVCTYKSK